MGRKDRLHPSSPQGFSQGSSAQKAPSTPFESLESANSLEGLCLAGCHSAPRVQHMVLLLFLYGTSEPCQHLEICCLSVASLWITLIISLYLLRFSAFVSNAVV